MRPSILPTRSLLAVPSLLLLAALISCGDGKPSRKDRHHDDHVAADVPASVQSAPSDDDKKDKHKNIPDATAAAYVAQTYLDNIRLGVARAYWYSWNGNPALVGIPMQPGSAAATAYNTVFTWLKGAFYSCTTATVNTCQTGDNNSPEVMAWASGKSGTFIVPPRASITCNALNQCSPVTPGAKMTIGSMPQWFGTAAPK